MVKALPTGNEDDEPQQHGKWSGQCIPVETSVDKDDGDPMQTVVR